MIYPNLPVTAKVRDCTISALTLTRFRCYQAAQLVGNGESLALIGDNASGKTSVLEAVSFFSPGRGLHNVRLDEVEHNDGMRQGWALAAQAKGSSGSVEIGTGYGPIVGCSDRRRLTRINGAVSSNLSLDEYFSVIWLTPGMERSLLEAAGRRRMLDRSIAQVDSAHSKHLLRHQHALRERSRLLKAGKGEPLWLAGLENILATTGVAIAAARIERANLWSGVCQEPLESFPRAVLSASGPTESMLLATKSVAAVEDTLRQAWQSSRSQDREGASPRFGAHRGDLQLHYRSSHSAPSKPLRECSTGERKSLLVALTLARARILVEARGCAPMLLLDEIAAHLDPERRSNLFAYLLRLEGQTWLTGADREPLAPLVGKMRFVEIRDHSFHS